MKKTTHKYSELVEYRPNQAKGGQRCAHAASRSGVASPTATRQMKTSRDTWQLPVYRRGRADTPYIGI